MSTVTVDASLKMLFDASNNLKSNTTYIIPNGTYKGIKGMVCLVGTNITLTAASPGGVIFTGSNVSVALSGSNHTFSGIQFVNTSSYTGKVPKVLKNVTGTGGGDLITVDGANHTVSNINMNLVGACHLVNVNGTSTNFTMGNCNIQNKVLDPSGVFVSSMVQLMGDNKTTNGHRIHHCTFQEMTQGVGGDAGSEPIRIGEGVYSLCNLNTVVEHCVFDNTWRMDGETISVKSKNNVIRYNTFTNNLSSFVSFRNGDNNIAYGNYFINSGGVRFKQANNISIYNNYFYQSDCPLRFVDATLIPDYKTLYHSNVNIQHNTFYNCNSVMVDTYQNVATNVFSNNIVYQDGTGPAMFQSYSTIYPNYATPTDPAQMPLILGTLAGYSVENNLIRPGSVAPLYQYKLLLDASGAPVLDLWLKPVLDLSGNPIVDACGNPLLLPWSAVFQVDASGIPAPGFIMADPQLQLNSAKEGLLVASSPAVGAAVTSQVPLLSNPFRPDTDASLTLDITGQTRNSFPKDVGCRQLLTTSSGLEVNRPLSVTDTGVTYVKA